VQIQQPTRSKEIHALLAGWHLTVAKNQIATMQIQLGDTQVTHLTHSHWIHSIIVPKERMEDKHRRVDLVVQFDSERIRYVTQKLDAALRCVPGKMLNCILSTSLDAR